MPLILSGNGTIGTSEGTPAISIDSIGRTQVGSARPNSLVRFLAGDVGSYTNMIVNTVARPTRIDINVGNCYNSSNGRFTAPIAGSYLFTFSTNMYMVNTPSWISPQTLKNGSVWAYHYGDRYTSAWQYFSFSEMHQLAAGDYLQLYFGSSGATYGSDAALYSPITFTHLG
jgi:hypothetical protein